MYRQFYCVESSIVDGTYAFDSSIQNYLNATLLLQITIFICERFITSLQSNFEYLSGVPT